MTISTFQKLWKNNSKRIAHDLSPHETDAEIFNGLACKLNNSFVNEQQNYYSLNYHIFMILRLTFLILVPLKFTYGK